MHIGIDLGTTNSALATFDGTVLSVVPNGLGENLTPSVVRIDARGVVTLGRRGQRFLESDPANTRAEFKRLMGTAERLRFAASGQELLPEELAAKVVASLLADARDTLGFAPRAAVISTPALFELPQNHATVRAGELAGLEEVQLIQEPIASAIAAGWDASSTGLWLVYDLGGGTLDVSLLETREGWLRVVDHGGDNFLGGKDFDQALVDWAAARINAEHGLALSRQEPAARRAFAKLKAAAEQAKIDLSRSERAALSIAELCDDTSGNPVDVDLEITRAQLESLIEPLVERSLEVCRALLARARVTPDAVETVVFVGGPTLTPRLRELVGGLFGGRIAGGLDPMTLVARGAALYAATAGLDARPRAQPAADRSTGLAVRIEHPAVTADVEPFVVGRILPAAGQTLPATVRAERADGGFVSPETEVPTEGSFPLQVELVRQQRNRFTLIASGADGAPVALATPSFAIVHGVTIADPPLSRSVGVARADGTVECYFEKGTPLPARRTVIHQTVKAVTPQSAEDLLQIPVVQGESPRAHRNRLIGTLQIPGSGLSRPLPAGSRLDVTLHLDRSGQLRARADLIDQGQTFEDVVHVLVPTASLEVLGREIEAAEERAADLRRRAWQARQGELVKALGSAESVLEQARASLAAAAGGDTDAAQRLLRLLLELGSTLDDAEDALRWPEVQEDADEKVPNLLSWIGGWGTPAEQRLAEQAAEAVAAGVKQRDARAVERQIKVLRALASAAHDRNPQSPLYVFDWYEARVAEATDVRLAHELVERGRPARQRRDTETLKPINRQLADLFPGDGVDARQSFGSGIQ